MNARTRLFWLYLAGGVVVGGVVWAAPFSGPPHTFQAGDPLSASALNANFAALSSYVNELAAQNELLGSRVDLLESTSAAPSAPAGTIVAFGGPKDKVPPGWELCDGRALDPLAPEYAALFQAIGTAHGGDGASSFHLPDYRGMFLRGVDDGRGMDPDADTRTAAVTGSGNVGDRVGSVQSDTYERHHHTLVRPVSGHGVGIGKINAPCQVACQPEVYSWHRYEAGEGFIMPEDPDAVRAAPLGGGVETRPRNAAVNFIIKL